jgi:hypothetical protein
MTGFRQVHLPDGYFFKMAVRDYYNWRTALFREFIQNSYDAGSTKLEIFYSEETGVLDFLDNGCGMDADVIENCLLTLGGTKKEGPSVGGLGKAKELIYFAWPFWTIASRDNFVDGREGTYRLSKEPRHMKGTRSRIQIGDRIETPKSYLADYLANSRMKMKVFFNGELIPQGEKVEPEKTVIYEIKDLGTLRRNRATGNGVKVLVRGLYMFTVHSVLDGSYIFEIERPSYDCLTANRDGFVGDWQDAFGRMVGKVAIDSESTCLRKEQIIYVNRLRHGEKQDQALSEIRGSQLGQAISSYTGKAVEEISYQDVAEFADANYAILEKVIDKSTDKALRTVVKAARKTKSFDACLGWYREEFPEGFVIVCENEVTSAVINRLYFRDYMKIAVLWRAAVQDVFKALEVEGKVGFGLVINDQVEAEFRDGYFLINPFKWDEMDWDVFSIKAVMLACHEIVHYLGHHHHNESFLVKADELLFKNLAYGIDTDRHLEIVRRVRKKRD